MPVPCAVHEHFIQPLEGLHQVVLEGGERCADGRAPEAVGYQAEVSQAALDPGLQDEGGAAVPQRRAVLGYQVCKLFTDLPGRKRSVLAQMLLGSRRDMGVLSLLHSLPPGVFGSSLGRAPGSELELLLKCSLGLG